MRNFGEALLAILIVLLGFISLAVFLVFTLGSVKFEASNQNVSGVVYNVGNDNFISGNTTFSVRASEDTYVSEENRSSYCLPKGSEYIALVNKAAEDKDIKVVVKTSKFFKFPALPWTCVDNVTVEEAKKD